MDDLIERLRSVKWEVTDDCGRTPDDPTHKCVFVDMRPDDFRALLREAAAALEAAREDGERWRQAFVDERASRYRADGMKIEQARIHAETDAEVAAIDQARGKGGCGEGKGE